jgi:hypothetical protein
MDDFSLYVKDGENWEPLKCIVESYNVPDEIYATEPSFEFNGEILSTLYMAGYVKIHPEILRYLFPVEYKAKRWIKRAKKIGKMNSHRFLCGHNRLIEKQLKAKRIWF